MTFTEFLDERGIDCQTIDPELLTALRQQYLDELHAAQSPSAVVIPDRCDGDQWQRAGGNMIALSTIERLIQSALKAGLHLVRAEDIEQPEAIAGVISRKFHGKVAE